MDGLNIGRPIHSSGLNPDVANDDGGVIKIELLVTIDPSDRCSKILFFPIYQVRVPVLK